MNRPSYLLIAFLLLGLVGCRDFTVESDKELYQRPGHREFTVTTTDPFEMAIGDIVYIEGTNLSFEFALLLSDSRCPANVQCIQAGDAEVLFQVTDGGEGGFQLVAQITGLAPTPYYENNIIQVQHLRFQLLSLTPYPVDGGAVVTDADYRATVSLTPVFN